MLRNLTSKMLFLNNSEKVNDPKGLFQFTEVHYSEIVTTGFWLRDPNDFFMRDFFTKSDHLVTAKMIKKYTHKNFEKKIPNFDSIMETTNGSRKNCRSYPTRAH